MWRDAAGTLRTVRDLLRFAVSRFEDAGLTFGHGTDNAFDEAAYLILHALHLPLERLEPFLDAALLPAEVQTALALLQRRTEARVPAAYLTHEAWLGEFRFYVDERVIVPRSHLAGLIRDAFSTWIHDAEEIDSALDLCTGSGCLAILLANAFPCARIDGVDISTDALAVANRNVGSYGLEQRVHVFGSDLFSALEDRRYGIIVSNPPYVPSAEMETLPPEYRGEPPLALAGGNDGLDFVRRIVMGARAHLKPGGWLAVEIGDNRKTLLAAFPHLPFIWPEIGSSDGQVFLLEHDRLPT